MIDPVSRSAPRPPNQPVCSLAITPPAGVKAITEVTALPTKPCKLEVGAYFLTVGMPISKRRSSKLAYAWIGGKPPRSTYTAAPWLTPEPWGPPAVGPFWITDKMYNQPPKLNSDVLMFKLYGSGSSACPPPPSPSPLPPWKRPGLPACPATTAAADVASGSQSGQEGGRGRRLLQAVLPSSNSESESIPVLPRSVGCTNKHNTSNL